MKAIKWRIVPVALENPSWGYCRIQGELKDVGHQFASTAIANVLKDNWIKPAPDRPSSWRTFLKSHWGEVAATDFFTTEVWTTRGLVAVCALFVIDLKTRRVHIAGIRTKPDADFVAQVARNLADMLDGFLLRHRFLICDRDTKFTAQFKRILKDAGVEVVLTAKRAPNCNAFAERFWLSIKPECLNRMIFFEERRLREAVTSFVEHYHVERATRGLGTSGSSPRSADRARSSATNVWAAF